MKKYNKNILKEISICFENKYIRVLVLDDKKFYNIHILDNDFQDDELNTLRLQEPKEHAQIEEITNEVSLYCIGMEHLLWNKFYGKNKKMYDFNINFKACDL